MDGDTRLHNSKCLISVNQPPHLTKERFAWIILSKSLGKIISSGSICVKSQGC